MEFYGSNLLEFFDDADKNRDSIELPVKVSRVKILCFICS